MASKKGEIEKIIRKHVWAFSDCSLSGTDKAASAILRAMPKNADGERLDWLLKPGVCVNGAAGKIMWDRAAIDASIRSEGRGARRQK